MIQIPEKGAVLTFGEILLRLSLDSSGQWIKNGKLPFFIGGAELNVATALTLWGHPARYVTAVPDNRMTAELLCHVAGQGIDVSAVQKKGKRLGLFYLSEREDMKHDALVYDREGSAFAGLTPGMINWDEVLKDIRWFHFSAISPALTQQTADVCLEAVMAARQRGITISVDLNYRAKLWQYGKAPIEIMPGLVKYCDVVMGNIWAAEKMLGLGSDLDFTDQTQKPAYLEAALSMSVKMTGLYPNCKAVAHTFRFGHHDAIAYYAALYTSGKFYHSATYRSDQVLSTVGSGDCFMAGLIYGACSNDNAPDTLNYATAAAFSKLFVCSDATDLTADQIKNSIKYEY